MATSPDYITYVCDQLAGFQPLRYRKMFGEYMVYLSDRPILTVCDNTVYVKMYPELAQLLDSAPAPPPGRGSPLTPGSAADRPGSIRPFRRCPPGSSPRWYCSGGPPPTGFRPLPPCRYKALSASGFPWGPLRPP